MSARVMQFPLGARDAGAGVLGLFRRGLMSHFQGRVQHIDAAPEGRVILRLRLSVGEVTVSGSRDVMPSSLAPGAWVHVRALRVYREDPAPLHITRVQVAEPEGRCAWLPTALCHRLAHLKRLRSMLDELDPAMQAAFMTAVADAQVQRRFFWRVGAADHHGYPGGLFDQSVQAALLVFRATALSAEDRSVAAAAALLFDLGKVFDPALTKDADRFKNVLVPHRMTPLRLRHSYEAADLVRPGAGSLLRAVLEPNPGSAVGGPPEVGGLAQKVRHAVATSFGLSA